MVGKIISGLFGQARSSEVLCCVPACGWARHGRLRLGTLDFMVRHCGACLGNVRFADVWFDEVGKK